MQLRWCPGHVLLIILSILGCARGAGSREITLNYQYFHDDGTTVSMPGLRLSLEPWEAGSINLAVGYDTVTSASEHRSSTVDSVSRASDYEHRLKTTIGLGQKWQLWTINLGGFYGHEPDYTSTALFWSLARDFFQRNTTLSIHGNYGYDQIFNSDDPDFQEESRRYGGALAITQVLSPKIISRVSFSFSSIDGYQANPYRYALRSGDVTVFENHEVMPTERLRYALFGQVNVFNDKVQGAYHQSYRYYWDDWGISSHELKAKLFKYLLPSLVVHIEARYYLQSEADFYREIWYDPADYMTSYAKYAAGSTYLLALGSKYSFQTERSDYFGEIFNALSIYGDAGYYYREADTNRGSIAQCGVTWKW